MMGPPPGYEQEQPESPFGEANLPPAQALTGYAAHAAQRPAQAPLQKRPAPAAGIAAAPQVQPKVEPEKKNGPSAAAIPMSQVESHKEDEDSDQT